MGTRPTGREAAHRPQRVPDVLGGTQPLSSRPTRSIPSSREDSVPASAHAHRVCGWRGAESDGADVRGVHDSGVVRRPHQPDSGRRDRHRASPHQHCTPAQGHAVLHGGTLPPSCIARSRFRQPQSSSTMHKQREDRFVVGTLPREEEEGVVVRFAKRRELTAVGRVNDLSFNAEETGCNTTNRTSIIAGARRPTTKSMSHEMKWVGSDAACLCAATRGASAATVGRVEPAHGRSRLDRGGKAQLCGGGGVRRCLHAMGAGTGACVPLGCDASPFVRNGLSWYCL